MRRRRTPKLAVVPYRHHPNLKWTISGYYVNGKRVRHFFKTRHEADTFIRQLQIKVENLGERALHIDPRVHYMAIDAQDKLAAFGKTIADAAEHYTKHLQNVERSCTVNQLVAEFIETKQSEGRQKTTIYELNWRLGRFAQKFGQRVVATFNSAECDDWLRKEAPTPRNRVNARRVLHALFAYAVMRNYCPENPISRIPKPKVPDKPIDVFTPAELQRLFEAANPAIIPHIAIGAFAGLRRAELSRLDWKEVHLDRNFIEVTALKSKTASRRLVPTQPNLKAWLTPYAKKAGRVETPNHRKSLEAAQQRAGLERWPRNGLRHSFASYHLAKFQDSSALALQLGHTTTGLLFAHYREVVTPEDAEAYWQIMPAHERKIHSRTMAYAATVNN